MSCKTVITWNGNFSMGGSCYCLVSCACSKVLLFKTDFKFIGKVESTTNDFYKTSVLAHFT